MKYPPRIERTIRSIPSYVPTAVVVVAILYLSLAPDPLPDQDKLLFPGADKVVHFIMYWGLSITYCFDYYRKMHTTPERKAMRAAFIAWIILGGAIEILQANMALGRSGDIIDFIADVAGVAVGLASGRLMWQHLHPKHSTH